MSLHDIIVKKDHDNKGHLTQDPLKRYAYEHSVKLHPAQEKLIERTMLEERHFMLGAPEEMQLFQILLKTIKAKRTLDIGVFTGFSSLSVAMVLPDDGKVVALDVTDEYLKRANTFELWKEAGVFHKIDLRIGEAVKVLEDILQKDGENSFDFAFIDADKPNYMRYYELAVKLVRPGGLIAVDNTLWKGFVLDANDHTPETQAIRALNDKIFNDDRVSVCLLPIADGVSLCYKK